MPKGNRQKKGGKTSGVKGSTKHSPDQPRPPGTNGRISSDDDNQSETNSIFSALSDNRSIHEESDGELDLEQTAQDDFEDKLKECIEGAMDKNVKIRQTAMESIRKAFSQRLCAEFLETRKITVADALERSLKKGRGEEQCLAASIASLLCVQLGAMQGGNEVCEILRPVMLILLQDTAASLKARAQCATAIGLCTYVAGSEVDDILEVMGILEAIFMKSYFKGDRTPPVLSVETTTLHANCLSCWTLLLSIAPSAKCDELLRKHISRLPELLESTDVELRIVAGEAIALFYELGRETYMDFAPKNIDDLCSMLKDLATDGNKYRAKKDRKQQRSSFRDILRGVQEGEYPDISIKFGSEVLYVDSWMKKRQYDCFCQVLGTGMNLHLQENELVRDIFELGSVLPSGAAKAQKLSKHDRHLHHKEAYKILTKVRSKQRDKRTVLG